MEKFSTSYESGPENLEKELEKEILSAIQNPLFRSGLLDAVSAGSAKEYILRFAQFLQADSTTSFNEAVITSWKDRILSLFSEMKKIVQEMDPHERKYVLHGRYTSENHKTPIHKQHEEYRDIVREMELLKIPEFVVREDEFFTAPEIVQRYEMELTGDSEANWSALSTLQKNIRTREEEARKVAHKTPETVVKVLKKVLTQTYFSKLQEIHQLLVSVATETDESIKDYMLQEIHTLKVSYDSKIFLDMPDEAIKKLVEDLNSLSNEV